MNFDFMTAARIIFGRGTFEKIGDAVKEFGGRTLVIKGGGHVDSDGTMDRLRSGLARRGVEAMVLGISGEPTVERVEELTDSVNTMRIDSVIGIGGGSVIDAAKAVAALASNGGRVLDYIEVIGSGRAFTRPSLPMIAVPTTSGTGSEVTKNAVLSSKQHGVKASLRGAFLLPKIAIVDPALTDGLPAGVTAATGMDAITQLLEPYVCRNSNGITDCLSLDGFERACRSIARVVENPGDVDARDDMSLASLFGGICLANSGLGAVHALAAVIGGRFQAPHGAVCGALLAPVVEMNMTALAKENPKHPVLERYSKLGTIMARGLKGGNFEGGEDLASMIYKLAGKLGIPGLAAYGIAEKDIGSIAVAALKASSMRHNPAALNEELLTGAIRKAL